MIFLLQHIYWRQYDVIPDHKRKLRTSHREDKLPKYLTYSRGQEAMRTRIYDRTLAFIRIAGSGYPGGATDSAERIGPFQKRHKNSAKEILNVESFFFGTHAISPSLELICSGLKSFVNFPTNRNTCMSSEK